MTIVKPGTARIMQGQAPGGLRWETAEWDVAPALRPYVREINGYLEITSAPLLRRELPAPSVVVILEFGPPIRVFDKPALHGAAASGSFQGGFVAGLNESCTLTRHGGRQQGIQLNLTPVGARLFFDIPARELTHRVVEFGDLVPEHRRLCERLAGENSWDARFRLVEEMLLQRIMGSGADERRAGAVAWFCRAIESGATDMGVLADRLGYSHKHVITLFREYTGLPPGSLARLHRFSGLVKRLKSVEAPDWSALALEQGYYDQSHLARETRRFAGIPPTKLLRELQDPQRYAPEPG